MNRPSGSGGPGSTPRQVREIFAGEGFRRYFVARLLSQAGDGLFQFAAAAVLLFENPGPNPVLDLLTISLVVLVPFSAIGPFVGVFIDRWQRHKILTRVPLLRAAVAAMLPVAGGLAGEKSIAFYAVVLIVLSANRFFLATMAAVLPPLVPPRDLLVANSVATTGGAVASVVGQSMGAALAGVVGGQRAALVAAAAFAIAAVAARRVPAPRGHDVAHAPLLDEVRQVLAEMRDGVTAVRGAPRVVYGLSAIGVVQLMVGALSGLLVYYFIAVMRLSPGAAFRVLVVLAAGIGAGVVLVPFVARRVRHEQLIPLALLIAAVGAVVPAVNLTRTMLLAGTAMAGVSYAFAKIPVDTIVQQEMANVVRGRAFALYDMLFNMARVGGVALAALAYHLGGTTQFVLAVIAACYVFSAGAFAQWMRRVVRRVATQESSAGA